MRNRYGVLMVGLALALPTGSADGQVEVGVGVDEYGIDHFQMALGDVYGMPVGPVPSYIDPDELPVIYMLAREAGVAPEVVMALREQGWSWLDITYHLGVDPYLYVSHLPHRHGYWARPVYRDYRYLTDRHIIDYVNLVFWATYHRRPVTQIIVIRHRVPTWRYYVHYHAPRIVYRSAPVWHATRRSQPPRAAPPVRRAQPRAESRTRTTARVTPPTREAARQNRSTVTQRPAPSRPATQQSRPAPSQRTTPPRPPTTQSRPATTQRPAPSHPAAQQSRPAATQRPAPSRPAAQQSRPAATQRPAPSRPTAQQSRPAAQRSRPAVTQRPAPSRPAAQQSRPAAQRSRPAVTQRTSPRASRSESTRVTPRSSPRPR